jgi:hypothetical protein
LIDRDKAETRSEALFPQTGAALLFRQQGIWLDNGFTSVESDCCKRLEKWV